MTIAHTTPAEAEPHVSGSPDTDSRSAVLSVSQTARLLGISEWLVLQQVRLGVLPHKRCGRRIVFSRDRLLAWLASD
jgi:excisionase family DNA binding protein